MMSVVERTRDHGVLALIRLEDVLGELDSFSDMYNIDRDHMAAAKGALKSIMEGWAEGDGIETGGLAACCSCSLVSANKHVVDLIRADAVDPGPGGTARRMAAAGGGRTVSANHLSVSISFTCIALLYLRCLYQN